MSGTGVSAQVAASRTRLLRIFRGCVRQPGHQTAAGEIPQDAVCSDFSLRLEKQRTGPVEFACPDRPPKAARSEMPGRS